MHVLKEFWPPTVHVQQNDFEKTFIEVCIPHLYDSFGTFWAQIGQLFEAQWVWSMFGNQQIAAIEGKCRRFRNSSECLKNHCAANNWQIWTQSVKMWITNFYKSFFKNILLYMNGGLSKFRWVNKYGVR